MGLLPMWMVRYILAAVFIWITLIQCSNGIKWLAVSKAGSKRSWNKTSDCSKRKTLGLQKPQVNICKRNLELMPVVASATEEAIRVCQDMFKDRRWNCSSISYSPAFMADLTGGSREQAFVYALTSATLAQAISRSCAVGATSKCSCGRLPNEPPPGEFKWGGCGDDIRFGSIFARMFTDSTLGKKKNSKLSQMNIHNNMAGRKLVEKSLSTACKCHGVSGSCSIKTCWKALPDMGQIADTLKTKYATAVEVRPHVTSSRSSSRTPRQTPRQTFPGMLAFDDGRGDGYDDGDDEDDVEEMEGFGGGGGSDARQGTGDSNANTVKTKRNKKKRERRLVPVLRDKQYFEESDLIYFTKSPDYCLPDASLGSLGTAGRECQRDDRGSGGCQSMCCGRGYTSQLVQMKHRCDCKYYWCCYVKCKTCTKQVEINRCR